MIRLIVFLAVLLGLAFGFSWLADHPGDVVLTWLNREVRFSTTMLAVGLLAFVAVILVVSAIVRAILRTPGFLGSFFERRRREKGWRALSHGMIAVGAGDPSASARAATEARRILGNEPLALLLEAQSAQLSGNRQAARDTFERMVQDPQTRLLGLRGLFVEAKREGDIDAARHFAGEANRIAPWLGWSGNAVIEAQTRGGDWDGALATLERNARNKVTDRAATKRQRAVLLTARAQELELGNPDSARNLAMEAHGLAPDLVPAAVLSGRLLARAGDIKRAARVLEATWKVTPHPEIAEAYAYVRPGDSAADRLARVKELVRVRAHHPECNLALTRAEMDLRNFTGARAALKPLLAGQPTQRTCLLMAEIEDGEHGATGRVREWLGRAVRAPRDATWVADGVISDHWEPISPVSGQLDAFEWKVPPEELSAPGKMFAVKDFGAEDTTAKSDAAEVLPPSRVAEEAVVEAAVVAEPLAIGVGAATPSANGEINGAGRTEPVAAAPPGPLPQAPAGGAVNEAMQPASNALVPPNAPTAPPPSIVADRSGDSRTSDKVVPMAKSGESRVVGAPPSVMTSYIIGKAPDDPGPDGGSPEADDPNRRFRLFS